MAGSLPQSGVELVAQGASAYISDIGKAAAATDKFAKEATDAAAKTAKATSSMGDGAKRAGDLYQDAAGRWRTTSGRFASDAEKAAQGVTNATSKMASTSGGHFSALGEIATGALRKIGEVAVSALGMAAQAAGKFLTDSVTSAADVEQTLNVLGATSGATAGELEKVRDRAIALGGDLELPNASAQDAAEAMLELNKAGFTVQESMDAAKGTLQLAAAAQISAGEAAAISAQAINSFGLAASDASRVADLLAGGANASSASMTDLSQGLQQGGFAFDAAGQHIEDLVTSLAALTNVGLTGSDAGTALKNAMMRLMNPTDKAAKLMNRLGIEAYDAQGNMKPWPEVLENIRKATAGMTAEQRNAALGTIFLSDGMKAMIPLLDMSAEEYAKLEANVTKAGSAQAVAGAQTVGFNGAIAGLQSQMETLQLIIGTQVLPLLTPLIQQFSAGAGIVGTFTSALLGSDTAFASLDDNLQAVVTQIDAVVAAFTSGDIVGAVGLLVGDILAGIAPIASGIVSQSQAWIAALGQWILDALPGMGANFAAFIQNIYTYIGTALPGIVAQLATWGAEFVAWLTKAVPLLLVEAGHFTASMLAYLADNLPAIMAQLAQWGGQFVLWLLNAIPPLIAAAGDLLAQMISWIIASLPGLGQTLEKWGKAFMQWIVDAWPGMLKAFNDLDVKFTGWLSGLAKRATDDGSVGKAIIDGMIKGINGAVGALASAAASAAKSALDAAKKALGIQSPSKAFEDEFGKQIPAGAAIGVRKNQGLITAATKGMAQASLTAAIAPPIPNNNTNTTTNSRVINYQPTYNGANAFIAPRTDVALARSLAL